MSDVKLLRKQIRNVIQDDLDAILKKEIFLDLQKQIASLVTYRMNQIEMDVKKTLKELDDRSRDMQSFVMRQVIAAEGAAEAREAAAQEAPLENLPTEEVPSSGAV